MVPVSRLPDLCLIALFKAMPHDDRMSARKVCSRWSELVVAASLCRRSLTLLIGSRTREEFASAINDDYLGNRVLQHVVKEDGTALVPLAAFTEWNSVLVNTLTEEDVEKMAATFRNTDQLLVVIGEAKPIDWQSLASLLNTWSNQLVKFRFYLDNDGIVSSTPFYGQFFRALNALPLLTNLTLSMPRAVCPSMPILPRLEEFALSSLQQQPYFLPSLNDYVNQSAPAPLRQIAFNAEGVFSNFNNSVMTPFLRLDAPLRALFTRVNSRAVLPNTCLEDVCANFVSLTYLSIHAGPSLRVLFRNLARLKHLLFLQLYVDFDQVKADDPPVAQLVSVKALQMMTVMRSHEQLSLLPIGYTMPNVQVISTEFTGSCETCNGDGAYDFGCDLLGFDGEEAENGTEAKGDLDGHLEEEGGNEEDNAPAEADPNEPPPLDLTFPIRYMPKTCFRSVFSQWKRECSSLRKIIYNFEFVHGSAEELLREE